MLLWWQGETVVLDAFYYVVDFKEAYDLVGWEVLYITVEFGMLMKLVWLNVLKQNL